MNDNEPELVEFTADIPAELRDEITAEARANGLTSGQFVYELWKTYLFMGRDTERIYGPRKRLADAAAEG
jgi:hypothetical protein